MHTRHAKTENTLLRILGAIFAAIIVALPVHAFISTWGGTAIGPLEVWKSWKEIALLCCVPLVIWLCALRPDVAKTILHSKITKLIIAYAVLTLIMAAISQASPQAVVAGLLMNLRFLGMFIIGYALVTSNPPWILKAKKWVVSWLLGTAVFLSVIGILQVTVIPADFLTMFGYDRATTIAPYILVDEHPDALRAFATMRGPNTLGAYLLLPLAVAILMWWRNKKRWWALSVAILTTITIVLTSARSAWLGALAMSFTIALSTISGATLKKWLLLGSVPAIAATGLFFWLATTIPELRLAVFHSGGSHAEEPLFEGSTEAHWIETTNGILRVAAQPLGYGVGASGPASFYTDDSRLPENYFVQIAEETGLIGAALFIAISIVIGKILWQQRQQLMPHALLASFIGINVVNVFLHGWADDPTAMTWWGLAGLWMFTPKNQKNQV